MWLLHEPFISLLPLLYSPVGVLHCLEESTLKKCDCVKLNTEEQEFLKLYNYSFNDEQVDLNLIMDLLHNICSTTKDGETCFVNSLLCVDCG